MSGLRRGGRLRGARRARMITNVRIRCMANCAPVAGAIDMNSKGKGKTLMHSNEWFEKGGKVERRS